MGGKVLVVDIELEVRSLLDDFLTGEGYQVILASNREEAIELAQRENPQVILLDIMMPGIDGIEICKSLKAAEKTRFIPVMMTTTLWDTTVEAIEAGAEDLVTKLFA